MRKLIAMSLLITLLPAVSSAQAILKKRDGQTVKGRIQDYIVQKGEDIDGQTHTISYNLIPGDAVASIDERGINLLSGKTFRLVVVRQTPPKKDSFNLAFAEDFLNMDSDVQMNISGVGPMTVRTAGGKNLTDKLLGSFRLEGSERKLVPEIQVVTDSGIINVPLEAIVQFRPRREKTD